MLRDRSNATRDARESRKRAPLTRGKKLAFFGTFLTISAVFAIAAFLAVDTYLHNKYDSFPNRKGYRGPVRSKKQADETRIVLIGGSTAFGYGVSHENSIPAILEAELRKRTGRNVSVINLALNNHGAYSFRPTLIEYEDLDYDGVILYEGYNDLGGPNTALFRHDSPLFATFGYYAVFPQVLQEKITVWRYGNLERAYREGKVGFVPHAPQKARSAEEIEASLAKATRIAAGDGECGAWSFYCQSMRSAIDYMLSRRKSAWVVTQPYLGDRHRDQQAKLRAMLSRRYRSPLVHHVNLGEAVSLSDPALAYDSMHLHPKGNRMIAERLADAIAPVITTQN